MTNEASASISSTAQTHLCNAGLIIQSLAHVFGHRVAVDGEVQVVAVASGVARTQVSKAMSNMQAAKDGARKNARDCLKLVVRANFGKFDHALQGQKRERKQGKARA